MFSRVEVITGLVNVIGAGDTFGLLGVLSKLLNFLVGEPKTEKSTFSELTLSNVDGE